MPLRYRLNTGSSVCTNWGSLTLILHYPELRDRKMKVLELAHSSDAHPFIVGDHFPNVPYRAGVDTSQVVITPPSDMPTGTLRTLGIDLLRK